MEKLYFDHAATTFMYDEVIETMTHLMKNEFGNPSSTHSFGQNAKAIIENSRKQIAQLIGADSTEIIFTSCGTEANNLIIRSSVENLGVKRIITTPLEHKCVLETTLAMKKNLGVEVVFLTIDEKGNYNWEDIKNITSDETPTLISLMQANNEIGNLYPIAEIAKWAREKPYLFFHSDTVQTMGHYPINVNDLELDFASASAHKFHGPKGIGFAYIKKNPQMKAQIFGGGQERNLRSGTENVYGIAGMAKALETSIKNMEKDRLHIEDIKQYAIQQLELHIPEVQFNGLSGDMQQSLYTVLNAFVPNTNPMLGFQLDLQGIALSQGSACSSGAAKVSLVMSRIRSEEELNRFSPLRISFAHSNTRKEIDYLVRCLKEVLLQEKV